MAPLGSDARDHILFCSDVPDAPDEDIEDFASQLKADGEVDMQDLRANELHLFPRLAA